MNKRDELLGVALELFSTKGYEKTTISDIVKGSNTSRGGFYHHFQSKEEVLSAITENYIDQFKRFIDQSLQASDQSSQSQFKTVFQAVINYKKSELSNWSVLHKLYAFKGNLPIILQLSRSFESYISDIYEQIIIKGNEEDVFTCHYTKQFAGLFTRELMLLIRQAQKTDSCCEEAVEALKTHVSFFEDLCNQHLGLSLELNIRQELMTYVNELEGLK